MSRRSWSIGASAESLRAVLREDAREACANGFKFGRRRSGVEIKPALSGHSMARVKQLTWVQEQCRIVDCGLAKDGLVPFVHKVDDALHDIVGEAQVAVVVLEEICQERYGRKPEQLDVG